MSRWTNLGVAILAACGDGASSDRNSTAQQPPSDSYQARREAMVRTQIAARNVRHPKVLDAMRSVPRHELVPEDLRDQAYADHPLPIGYEQTISQPYVVAWMTELAAIADLEAPKVLEIGTGSGYQAAVLAELGVDVYSIEIVAPLAERARRDLRRLGYERVEVRQGDGYQGWPEHAPFDAVLLTAAPPEIPEPLLHQVKIGGRLIAPVGVGVQDLVVVTRSADGFERRVVAPVRFVPMTGQAQNHD